MPLAHSRVPSIGSTATSTAGPVPSPTSSPLNSIGAWSFSPSPMTTTPRMDTELMSVRIAFTAAPSAPFLSPRPTQRAAAIAAASVTRASSSARFLFGACCAGWGVPGMPTVSLSSVMEIPFPLRYVSITHERAFSPQDRSRRRARRWLAPAFPCLVECPGEKFGRLRPGPSEPRVEYEERDAADAELLRLGLVLAHLVGPGVAVEHLTDRGRVKTCPGGDIDDHFVVEYVPRLREIRLVHGGEQLPLHALREAQVDHPVQVDGIADRAFRFEAEALRAGQARHLAVRIACLRYRHVEFPPEHLQVGLPALVRRVAGVKLERVVHHLDLIAVREAAQRLLEPRLADVAPWADDVAPDIHAHVYSLECPAGSGYPAWV